MIVYGVTRVRFASTSACTAGGACARSTLPRPWRATGGGSRSCSPRDRSVPGEPVEIQGLGPSRTARCTGGERGTVEVVAGTARPAARRPVLTGASSPTSQSRRPTTYSPDGVRLNAPQSTSLAQRAGGPSHREIGALGEWVSESRRCPESTPRSSRGPCWSPWRPRARRSGDDAILHCPEGRPTPCGRRRGTLSRWLRSERSERLETTLRARAWFRDRLVPRPPQPPGGCC